VASLERIVGAAILGAEIEAFVLRILLCHAKSDSDESAGSWWSVRQCVAGQTDFNGTIPKRSSFDDRDAACLITGIRGSIGDSYGASASIGYRLRSYVV